MRSARDSVVSASKRFSARSKAASSAARWGVPRALSARVMSGALSVSTSICAREAGASASSASTAACAAGAGFTAALASPAASASRRSRVAISAGCGGQAAASWRSSAGTPPLGTSCWWSVSHE